VWTNPDGLSWMEVLTDEDKVGCFVALTPTWNESAYYADYVLPVGHASERHDTHSYEQYDGQWIGFRQPVLRAARGQGAVFDQAVAAAELDDVNVGAFGRVYTAALAPDSVNVVPQGAPEPDEHGRRAVGVMVDGVVRRGFPTPSGRLEFWSSTLAAWGWPEHALPGYIRSHVHPAAMAPDQMVLLSTFRLPTQIHTRSANSKWLDALAHTNPVWIHPADAARLGVTGTGDLVRVTTEIGYFVAKAWITEGSVRAWSPAAITWAAGSCARTPRAGEPWAWGP